MSTDKKPNVFGPGEYRCAKCGGIFQGDVSTEESLEEVKANGWEHIPKEQMDVICEDCYQKMVAARSPREVNKELTGSEVVPIGAVKAAERNDLFQANLILKLMQDCLQQAIMETPLPVKGTYEVSDFLLIRKDNLEVLAVSANADFEDIDDRPEPGQVCMIAEVMEGRVGYVMVLIRNMAYTTGDQHDQRTPGSTGPAEAGAPVR